MKADRLEPASPLWTSAQRQLFRRQLRAWGRQHVRVMPWKGVRDPYRVWLSEIMLQQTTVAAVEPYFHRFLNRFPDVRTLAAAQEAEVLQLWEGLGYYSRARNLHRAAQMVVTEFGGQFPAEPAQLETLPGVGRYTAGAIASFAFDVPAPIVEANTLRLYCRLLAYPDDPRSTAGQKLLWRFAEELVPREEPGAFNQALIDLGAGVCKPAAPACSQCPVRRCCAAVEQGLQHDLPRLSKRAAVTEVTQAYVAVRYAGKYLLRQRQAGERWAGMWDFLRFDEPVDESSLVEQTRQLTGLTIVPGPQVAEWKHSVTRYSILLKSFVAEAGSDLLQPGQTWKWVTLQELTTLPLPVSGRKLAQRLAEGLW